jgi:hypothetical protein
MRPQQFMLKLNRAVTAHEVEALSDGGCDDASLQTLALGTFLEFSRDASTLAEAIVTAALDLEKIDGLRAVGVYRENMVNLRGIAKIAGVTHEAVRLWAAGRRSRGGFPSPIVITPAGEQLWDWQEVANWLRRNQAGRRTTRWTTAADLRLRTLSAAHHVLAAREALTGIPNETACELEALLLGFGGTGRGARGDPVGFPRVGAIRGQGSRILGLVDGVEGGRAAEPGA